MKLKHSLLFVFIFLFIDFVQSQSFTIDKVPVKNYLGVSSLPGHGYAYIMTKGSQVSVVIKDLDGKDLTKFVMPQKMVRTGMKRIVKPKVYFNGNSYCVVPPKKMSKQSLFTFDLNGKKLGKKIFDGLVQSVNPIQEGYIVGYGPKFGKGKKVTLSNSLKKRWDIKPNDASVSKFKMDFILATGSNISSKKITFAEPQGKLISEEYRYSSSVNINGKEDRYLFAQENLKGGEKLKKQGIVCVDTKGKELFSEFYGEKEKNFLQAVSDNQDVYILYRKFPTKSRLSNSFAEIVKYDASGKKVKSIEIDGDDFPVKSVSMHFFMEKTPDGIALLADARGHFYSLYLDGNLEKVGHYDFEGMVYKKSKKKPAMSAIGGFPYRALFSGIAKDGVPYLLYLDKKRGKETVRCVSFDGKNLLSAAANSKIESQIATYYQKLNPLMRSMAGEYGESYSFHDIYTNLVHPKRDGSFVINTFVELKKQIVVEEYTVGN